MLMNKPGYWNIVQCSVETKVNEKGIAFSHYLQQFSRALGNILPGL